MRANCGDVTFWLPRGSLRMGRVMRRQILIVGAMVGLVALTTCASAAVAVAAHDPSYRYVQVKFVTDQVTRNTIDKRAVALEIMRFVVQQTPFAPSGVAGDPEFPDVIDDHAWGTLVRGRGYCDSQAMAVVQMLKSSGIDGELLFLRTPTGESPHSVAVALIDGERLILDPLYGAVPTSPDGKWMTVEDMADLAKVSPDAGYGASSARESQGYGQVFVRADWFPASSSFLTTAGAEEPMVRRLVEGLLNSGAQVLDPGIQLLSRILRKEPNWLPNAPDPGDVHYERGREWLLKGDRDRALHEFSLAREAGTQWEARITYLEALLAATDGHAIELSELFVPVTLTQGADF